MEKLLVLVFALTLGSMSCGSSDDKSGVDAGSGTGSDAASSVGSDAASTSTSGTCQSAAYNVLVGSCSIAGLYCFEEYGQITSAEVSKAVGDYCTQASGTWSAGNCPAVTGGCKCTDTHGGYKMISYFSTATGCVSCTGDCKSAS